MCGITGKLYFNNDTVSEQDILIMNEKIKHRGPDNGGVYISPNKKVGLGHRRLSIIDLSPRGHQPMSYLNRYWIVFNGEIYNFQEKGRMLEKNGYKFRSKTDTEIILALYDKFGKNCLDHLRGMFAFAIYDEKEKTIFCARDRIGKKPFKYYLDNNVFIFASELKAILTQKEYAKEPDYEAIHHFLTFQYCPAPFTGFKNIKKLEPAHYLFINLNTKKIEKERYWKLDYSEKWNISEEEWRRKILEKLEECVKLRMISDVPLGAFLSGGIDSSAIVGMMSKLSDKPIKTFSIGFAEQKYNELPYARLIARNFKTEHTEFVVKYNDTEILPFLVKQYEEPYADNSALATYFLSKLTKKYITVTLNGDGGDENFGGYNRYSIQKLSFLYERFSLLNKTLVQPLTTTAAKNIKNNFFHKAYRFSSTIKENYSERYANYIGCFTNKMKCDLYTDDLKSKMKNNRSEKIIIDGFTESSVKNKLDQTFYFDIKTYLPDDLMTKVDMASMAVSLEARSPLLDFEFMQLTAKIPSNLKLKGINNKKYIFKKSLKDLLPKEILNRSKKGFDIPIDIWLRNDLKKFAHEILLSPKASTKNMFKREMVQSLWNRHMKTKINFANQIWTLLLLELWFREYFN